MIKKSQQTIWWFIKEILKIELTDEQIEYLRKKEKEKLS